MSLVFYFYICHWKETEMSQVDFHKARRLQRTFWSSCIPVRIAVLLVFTCTLILSERRRDDRQKVRLAAAVLLFVPAAGFWFNALVRKPRLGGLGGVVWWGQVRWVHAVLWSLAGLSVVLGREWHEMSALLGADVALGVAAGSFHYSRANQATRAVQGCPWHTLVASGDDGHRTLTHCNFRRHKTT